MNPQKRSLSQILNEKKEKEKETSEANTAPVKPVNKNRPACREGKRQVAGHFDEAVHKQLRVIAAQEDKSLQDVMADAFNMYFRSLGLPPIA